MINITLSVDNKYACSLSPEQYIIKKILRNVDDCSEFGGKMVVNTNAAIITIEKIEQI